MSEPLLNPIPIALSSTTNVSTQFPVDHWQYAPEALVRAHEKAKKEAERKAREHELAVRNWATITDTDDPMPMEYKVKKNNYSVASDAIDRKQKEQNQKNAQAALGVLGMSMPSTYINLYDLNTGHHTPTGVKVAADFAPLIYAGGKYALGKGLQALTKRSLGSNVEFSKALLDQFGNRIVTSYPTSQYSYPLVTDPRKLIDVRADRLGMTTQQYVDYINSLIVRTPEEAATRASLYGWAPQDVEALKTYLSSPNADPIIAASVRGTSHPGFIYVGTKDISAYPASWKKHLFGDVNVSDPALLKRSYVLFVNHEGTHSLLNLLNLVNRNAAQLSLREAGVNANEIFNMPELINGQNVLSTDASVVLHPVSDSHLRYLYNSDDGFREAIARVGLMKDALGITHGQSMTADQVKYLMNNYTKLYGDNNMTDFFDSIKNIYAFVKWANSPTVKRIVGLNAAGAVTGKAINYLDTLKNSKGGV